MARLPAAQENTGIMQGVVSIELETTQVGIVQSFSSAVVTVYPAATVSIVNT